MNRTLRWNALQTRERADLERARALRAPARHVSARSVLAELRGLCEVTPVPFVDEVRRVADVLEVALVRGDADEASRAMVAGRRVADVAVQGALRRVG